VVNQAGLPEEPTLSGNSGKSLDDIPIAQRDELTVAPSSQTRRRWRFVGWVAIGVALALAVSSLLAWRSWQPESVTVPSTPVEAVNPSPSPLVPDGLLGHFPYAEAPTSSLKAITRDGRIKLRETAADQFTAMAQAAQADEVTLVPLSGFRSLEDQTTLFFERKAELGQRPAERASVSAPPGYSEHHTGYAIDIGDGTRPETDLELTFASTSAFRWLQVNAARFGYELSFPRNNPQGVSYEPWHWRFVGDRHSLETFYKSRQIRPVPAPSPKPSTP